MSEKMVIYCKVLFHPMNDIWSVYYLHDEVAFQSHDAQGADVSVVALRCIICLPSCNDERGCPRLVHQVSMAAKIGCL